jgi:hypothetical protein
MAECVPETFMAALVATNWQDLSLKAHLRTYTKNSLFARSCRKTTILSRDTIRTNPHHCCATTILVAQHN